jgi:hypothetical protein
MFTRRHGLSGIAAIAVTARHRRDRDRRLAMKRVLARMSAMTLRSRAIPAIF